MGKKRLNILATVWRSCEHAGGVRGDVGVLVRNEHIGV